MFVAKSGLVLIWQWGCTLWSDPSEAESGAGTGIVAKGV